MAPYQLLPGGGGSPRPGLNRRLLLLIPLVALALLWTTRSKPQQVEVQQQEEQVALTTDIPPEPTSTTVEAASPVSTAPPELEVEGPPFIPFNEPLPCNRLTTTKYEGQTWPSPSPPLPADASLSSRLESLLDAPLASHGNWTKFNNQTCGNPSVSRTINVVHERNSREQWEELSEDRVRQLREGMAEVLRKADKEGRFKSSAAQSKRGIVFTAGNADTVSRVIVSLRLLRSYGTTLPAEVFHFSTETPANEHLDTLKSLNAIVRTVEGVDKAESQSRTKSFHIKGAALVQSSFDELLYLDSDAIPSKNVESLFETKGFKELGAMFWSDYWKDSAENAIWRILGVQCRDEFTMESGQILIDKRRHLDALLLVEHMLQDWPFWFKISDGDKDLFRYAFLALRKRWAVPGRTIGSASWTNEAELGEAKKGDFCGHTMLQSDERGEPQFVHANLLKRIAGNFYSGGTWGRTRQLSLPRLPLVSAFSPSAATEFATSADHLANANSLGLALLPAPPHIRKRAALERGLNTFFHQGHRGSAYVLCVQTQWTDPRWTDEELAERLEGDLDEEELETPREEQCGPTSAVGDVGYNEAAMEVVPWEDDAVLKEFEAAFYKVGGKANGHGFR
ncbi:mannosyltransferase putative-domain-containing protein [Leucosporidium creatinivorum]|uniref:Mannosyltransferase putative-domain-containing protein n=1 Tax=Leucosporidium creatinivorum TaxID=106004 RepID=A0A1Y2FXP8_9BASI|nr:mannosyltransferase putative-domain-containing protein [Leucosporidium creatinivorum]